MSDLEPKDFADMVANLIRNHTNARAEWVDMPTVWQLLQQHEPKSAKQIEEKVNSYKRPKINNPVWYVHRICVHVGKFNDFEFSKIRDEDDITGKDYNGLIRLNN